MVTDDERSEAAERLRDEVGCGSSWPGMERLGFILGIKREPRKGWEGRILTRLADLIDPDCEEGRYEGVRTARPVDREALLALADEMDERAPYGWYSGERDSLRDYARRIREACGEVVE